MDKALKVAGQAEPGIMSELTEVVTASFDEGEDPKSPPEAAAKH